MLRYAIIEDNVFALELLKRLVGKLRPSYDLVFTGGTVKEAVDLLKSNPPDLLFLDIELSDGKCFSIFENLHTTVPIIFTTAYSEFAIQAFKVNSVDYLLKPITECDLANALDKFELFRANNDLTRPMPQESFSPRILTESGDKYSYIDIKDVEYFMSEDNYVFAHLKGGVRCMIKIKNLSELEAVLPHNDFFRISRNIITSIWVISSVSKFFRGRLSVVLDSSFGLINISVSASRRDEFLVWYGR